MAGSNGITVRKVNALVALLQRTPVSEAEAIFASEFVALLRSIAEANDASEKNGAARSPQHRPDLPDTGPDPT